MTFHDVLILLLAVSTAALLVLLAVRIRREKRQMAAVRGMRLEDFSEFLRSNSVDGGIVEVARKVSDLLIKSFGCNRIVFVRKKRGALDLNYSHGIGGFKRGDFHLTYSEKLADVLRADFLPRPVGLIKELLSERFYRALLGFGIDVFFPVFWRQNLYGIYFIRSNIETRSPAFALLAASLAQSLSAAYHIKWHEAKYDSLQKQLEESKRPAAGPEEIQPHETRFLKLVRHRRTQTVVNRIVDSFRDATGLGGVAYVYASREDDGEPTALRRGIDIPFEIPDNRSLSEIISLVKDSPYHDLNELPVSGPTAERWKRDFLKSGLRYVASFPLSAQRAGLLAWSQGSDTAAIEKQLEVYRDHALHLFENAESFERVEEMSYTDGLTGLANQRYFFKRLHEEINRAKRYNRNLALIIFDLDELKYTNDTYGHLAGDAILRQMGGILSKTIRAIDVIARYGGDEFCVIMPETNETMCLRFMRRLQTEILNTQFVIEGVAKPIGCTVSIGGAVFPKHATDSKKLIFAADMALLKAKETGRNKSLLYAESP
ncbi:MAG: GGDEF domain-containing protein [Candidatus Zixiibacteriota bacterium]|nr:MAG: GGDEF domain-containing protein [candidate division Zixibacteria bacterium]